MKKTVFLSLFLFFFSFLFAQQEKQVATLPSDISEIYLTIQLENKEQLRDLSHHYSIDNVAIDAQTGKLNVRIWLAQQDFNNFLALEIPFTIYQEEFSSEKAVTMAYSYSEMMSWNKYPTYTTYLAMMDTFQKRYPTLCKIDTILAATPGNRMILAAHISSSVNTPANKPNFFYTSTMHGDEVTGFYCMLRLIDHLLSNYHTDSQIMKIVNGVNLWICPNENPDGTYRSGNNVIGSSPTSTRANSNGVDLNRSFPHPLQSVQNLQPEVQAMMNFAAQHPFVASANFHGGAELANYPWDAWTTRQQPHADDAWWSYVSRNYADSCQFYGGSSYFNQQNNGITNGGDWYVVYGSRQDYMNYYAGCREMTLEISNNKTPSANNLPYYWNANRSAILHYIEESLYGFRGLVFDAYTEAPLEAEIFVNDHDNMNSQVFSHLPIGNYHRPIKAGTYSVTFSAEGYCPRTFTLTTRDKQTLLFHVALTPCDENGNALPDTNASHGPHYPLPFQDEEIDNINAAGNNAEIGQNDLTQYMTEISEKSVEQLFSLSPNPTNNACFLTCHFFTFTHNLSYQLIDIYGRVIATNTINASVIQLPVNSLHRGLYFVRIHHNDKLLGSLKMIKN